MRTLALVRRIRRDAPDVEITVLLASLQDTFLPLYEAAGADVVDISKSRVDYATHSNLSPAFDWAGYIRDYLVPTFLNGERILDYLAWYEQLRPDLVVSDYNTNASLGAVLGGHRHALVTERYDFTLSQIDDATLEEAGFTISAADLARARAALRKVFDVIVRTAVQVLTDKPYVEELDADTALARALECGSAHFVGPMIREVPVRADNVRGGVRAQLGLGTGPLIVASVGGTTMFLENKRRLIDTYLEAFRRLRAERPDLQLVLLGREEIEVPSGVVALPYLADWMPLLQEAQLLLSAPGWITVTEIGALRVPTLFVLSSYAEYHEVEALRRLAHLGFSTYVGVDPDGLTPKVASLLGESAAQASALAGCSRIAPFGSGTGRAGRLLLEAAGNVLMPAGA
jgi:hypothetical protein